MNYAFDLPYDYEGQIGALRLHFISNLKQTFVSRVLLILIAVFTLAMLFTLEGPIDGAKIGTSLLAGVIATVIFLAIIYAIQFATLPFAVRRAMKQLKLDGVQCRYVLSDGELVLEDPIMGGRVPWEDLHRWTENQRFLMVYRSDNLFYYFPKWRIPDGAEEAIRNRLVQAAVTRF